MADDVIRKKYGIDELLGRVPQDKAELVRGYSPWREDLREFQLDTREMRPEGETRVSRRTIWNQKAKPAARLLIEITECASAADAIEALADRLAQNQLDQLPPGPPDLGFASFVHPEQAPPAVFLAVDNLSVMVASFGREGIPVIPIATQLIRRFQEPPSGEGRKLEIAVGPARDRPGDEIQLNYTLPVPLEDESFLKFVVSGATLKREGERLLLRLQPRGRLRVDAFLIESGREPWIGSLDIPIE